MPLDSQLAPHLVITDRYVNNTFVATYVSATVDFEINDDAVTGPHDFTLTGTDTTGATRMEVTGQVYIYRNRKASFVTWWALLTGGGVMLLIVTVVGIGIHVSEFRQRRERIRFSELATGAGIALVALVGAAVCLWFGVRGLLEAVSTQ